MHDDELDVSRDLVRSLLADADPALAGLPLLPLTQTGSTNALWRLGDDLLVRLPRQPGGSAAIRTEARWSPVVGDALPVPVPQVVLVGEPGHGYPEAWSVVRWLPGRPPVVRRGGGSGLAGDLAAVLSGLRAAEVPRRALEDPALRSYRAGPLGELRDDGHEALEACRDLPGCDLDVDAARSLWDRLAAMPWTPRTAWVHGDLLAENLLVDDAGRLAAVLDLGGLAVGHPAVDLAVAWELLDATGRRRLRDQVGVDDDEWSLGAGWALLLAAIALPYYWHTLPGRCADRLVVAHHLLAELG